MTIQDALSLADEMRPNMMTRKLKVKYLNEIEGIIYDELLMQHEHLLEEEPRPNYTEESDPGTVLIAPEQHAMVYVYWLLSKIDTQTLEYEKYNNDRLLFDNQYAQLSDWWTRNRMPIQREREFRI